jgi:hypothetical protein
LLDYAGSIPVFGYTSPRAPNRSAQALKKLDMAFDTHMDPEAIANARRIGRELRRLGVKRRIVAHLSPHRSRPISAMRSPSLASTPGRSSASYCAVPTTSRPVSPVAPAISRDAARTGIRHASCG